MAFFYFKVNYPSGVEVNQGNELTPTQVKDVPTVSWDAKPDNYYVLAMTGKYESHLLYLLYVGMCNRKIQFPTILLLGLWYVFAICFIDKLHYIY